MLANKLQAILAKKKALDKMDKKDDFRNKKPKEKVVE